MWFLSLIRRQKSAVNLTLTFMLSLEWARLEKELKDGSTACATAIKHFDMTADWQWWQQKRRFFFSFFLFLFLFFFFFFPFFTLAPNAQKKRESNLSSSQKQVPKVCLPLLIPPLLSLPPLSCLSLSAAESSFKSLFFMYVSTVRRWSVSVSFLAGSVSSPPEDCSFTVT